MQRLDFFNDVEDPIHQSLSLEIAQVAQRQPAISQMSGIVRITARTTQRTLPRNLQRKGRTLAAQNLAPRLYNFLFFHYVEFREDWIYPVDAASHPTVSIQLSAGFHAQSLITKFSTTVRSSGRALRKSRSVSKINLSPRSNCSFENFPAVADTCSARDPHICTPAR